MKNFNTFYLVIIFLFFSCNSKSDSSISNGSEAEIHLSEFHQDSLKGMRWINKIYDSINEPKLYSLDHESYRFNYLDSFGKNILFRVESYNERDIRLIIKLYDKERNYEDEIYSLTSESIIELTKEQYHEFKDLIDGSYFWSMKMFEKPMPQYLDGYGYLLEGFKPKNGSEKDRYHIVTRTVPHDGSFRRACEKLMEFYKENTQH